MGWPVAASTASSIHSKLSSKLVSGPGGYKGLKGRTLRLNLDQPSLCCYVPAIKRYWTYCVLQEEVGLGQSRGGQPGPLLLCSHSPSSLPSQGLSWREQACEQT